jgi:hypothetical protein
MEEEKITMTSGVSPEGKPFVHYLWDDKKCQWSPDEARQHALHLLAVAEAAEHDSCIFKFFRDKMDLDFAGAATVIADFRNYRSQIDAD